MRILACVTQASVIDQILHPPPRPPGDGSPRRRAESPLQAGPREPRCVTRPTPIRRRPDRLMSTAPRRPSHGAADVGDCAVCSVDSPLGPIEIPTRNSGGSAATGIVLVDSLRKDVDFKLGSVTSNLGTSALSITMTYSNNGGVFFVYTPVSAGGGAPAGYDRTVSSVHLIFTGRLSQTSPNNAASVGLTARIR